MAYVNKNTLISKPITAVGSIEEALGDIWDTIKGGASSAVDFFGNSLKAQGAASALQAQAAAQAQAQAAASRPAGGISTTTLAIGGAAAVAVIVLAMRRK